MASLSFEISAVSGEILLAEGIGAFARVAIAMQMAGISTGIGATLLLKFSTSCT